MSNQRDNYNFTLVSPQTTAGFVVLKKSKLYYFLFNDAAGMPILYSQAYKQASGRNNGIQSVANNINQVENVIIFTTNKDSYYFTIKAKNNQEIARSREFENEQHAQAAIEYIRLLLQEKLPTEESTRKAKTQVTNSLEKKLINLTIANNEKEEKIKELEFAVSQLKREANATSIKEKEQKWKQEKTEIQEEKIALEQSVSELMVSLKRSLEGQEKSQRENQELTKKVSILTEKLSAVSAIEPEVKEHYLVTEEFQNNKYAFRIDYYPNTSTGSEIVKIERLGTKVKQTFQQLDITSLFNFIHEQIPSDSKKKIVDLVLSTQSIETNKNSIEKERSNKDHSAGTNYFQSSEVKRLQNTNLVFDLTDMDPAIHGNYEAVVFVKGCCNKKNTFSDKGILPKNKIIEIPFKDEAVRGLRKVKATIKITQANLPPTDLLKEFWAYF